MSEQSDDAIDRDEYDTEDFPQFRATFDESVLRDLRAPFDFDVKSARLVATEDSLLIEAKNPENTASVAIELDPGAFGDWIVNATGAVNVDGPAYRGLVNILSYAPERDEDDDAPFEVSLTEDGLSMQATNSSYGGKVPNSARDPAIPNVEYFREELEASAALEHTHSIQILAHDVDIDSYDARAEFAADHGSAHLTYKDSGEGKRLPLDAVEHPDGERVRGVYHPEYVTLAFDSLSHLGCEVEIAWGEDFPVVLMASTEHATYEAMVSPRVEGDEETPFYETASSIQETYEYGGAQP